MIVPVSLRRLEPQVSVDDERVLVSYAVRDLHPEAFSVAVDGRLLRVLVEHGDARGVQQLELPADVVLDEVCAHLHDGRLEIVCPRDPDRPPLARAIPIAFGAPEGDRD